MDCRQRKMSLILVLRGLRALEPFNKALPTVQALLSKDLTALKMNLWSYIVIYGHDPMTTRIFLRVESPT